MRPSMRRRHVAVDDIFDGADLQETMLTREQVS
jgi:hypothetical protein